MNKNNRRFLAALIDMDGVLYDSMPRHTRAWHRMMSGYGYKCTPEEFFLYEGMTGAATIRLVNDRQPLIDNLDDEKVKAMYAVKSDYFNEQGLPPMMPGADRMLQELMAADVKRVLVTGSAQASVMERLDKDYPGAFLPGMRITAKDVKHGKPNPEPYLMGLQRAGVDADRAMVIENAPLGVQAGVAAGCFTVAVTTGPIPRQAFVDAGADMIFDSMNDFADYLPNLLI